MNLYVMRHGTTIWNERKITQGRSNNRLSSAGIEQTKQTAEKYKDIKFDVVYCSPLMRTVQTANLMNKFHKVKVIKDERLIEIDQGIFTGRYFLKLTEEERALKASRAKSAKMESVEEVCQRTIRFLEELKKNCNSENILVVTHNVNASCIENFILNKKAEIENVKCFKNAEVKRFQF